MRGGRRRRTLFPPSVFPLWKPPFLIPPFKRNPPKGENRGGHQRGGLYGADGGMEPLDLHAFHAPRQARGLPSARRRPTGCRRHSAAQPPLRLPPPGAGRVGQAATGSARSGLRHGVGLPWCRLRRLDGVSQTRLVVLTSCGNNPRFTIADVNAAACRCKAIATPPRRPAFAKTLRRAGGLRFGKHRAGKASTVPSAGCWGGE